MQELIERLEQAAEGNRDLDAAIAVAVFKTASTDDDLIYAKMPQKADDCASGTYWRCSRSGMSLHTSPYYTTSLDAARTLVPEGCVWSVSELAKGIANVWRLSPIRPHIPKPSKAATPALALCIAALKARP